MSNQIKRAVDDYIGNEKVFSNKEKQQIMKKVQKVQKDRGLWYNFKAKYFPGLKYVTSIGVFAFLLFIGINLTLGDYLSKTNGSLTNQEIIGTVNGQFTYLLPIIMILTVLIAIYFIFKRGLSFMQLNKVKNYALLALTIIVIIMGTMLYQEKATDKRQYELFLNHFYHHLGLTISSIDSALSIDTALENEHLIGNLHSIDQRLVKTDLMLRAGNMLVNDEIRTENIFFIHRGIPEFGEDGEIDEDEASYLRAFRAELETIRQGMYAEETGQENPNLTIEQFNEILMEVTNNSVLRLE